MAKRRRLNLALTEEARTKIENLQRETGAKTMTEVISKSVAIYDYIWTKKKSGAKVLIQSKNKKLKEMVIL
ncbi:hypothetical protein ES708_15222 [subsurface metagenome]